MLGCSHFRTLQIAYNTSSSLLTLRLWDEAKSLLRNELLTAQQSLGLDHDLPLELNRNLALALMSDPERTSDDPRLTQRHPPLRRQSAM